MTFPSSPDHAGQVRDGSISTLLDFRAHTCFLGTTSKVNEPKICGVVQLSKIQPILDNCSNTNINVLSIRRINWMGRKLPELQ
jgi:hypothetical protein